MEKEELTVLAQILTGMKDALEKLSEAYKKGDMEGLASAKKEILALQEEADKRL